MDILRRYIQDKLQVNVEVIIFKGNFYGGEESAFTIESNGGGVQVFNFV